MMLDADLQCLLGKCAASVPFNGESPPTWLPFVSPLYSLQMLQRVSIKTPRKFTTIELSHCSCLNATGRQENLSRDSR